MIKEKPQIPKELQKKVLDLKELIQKKDFDHFRTEYISQNFKIYIEVLHFLWSNQKEYKELFDFFYNRTPRYEDPLCIKNIIKGNLDIKKYLDYRIYLNNYEEIGYQDESYTRYLTYMLSMKSANELTEDEKYPQYILSKEHMMRNLNNQNVTNILKKCIGEKNE